MDSSYSSLIQYCEWAPPCLQVLSNDRFKAPLHRVLPSRGRKRYSAPFFFNPRPDADISPLPMVGPACPHGLHDMHAGLYLSAWPVPACVRPCCTAAWAQACVPLTPHACVQALRLCFDTFIPTPFDRSSLMSSTRRLSGRLTGAASAACALPVGATPFSGRPAAWAR